MVAVAVAALDEAALGVAVDVGVAVAGDADEECEDEAGFEHVLIIDLRCGRKAGLKERRYPTFGQQKHRVRDSKYCVYERLISIRAAPG